MAIKLPFKIAVSFQKGKDIIQILFLILIAFISYFLCIEFRFRVLETTLIFFGTPILFMILLSRQNLINAILTSIIISIPMSIIIDYLGAYNKQWVLSDSLTSYRVFQLVSLEMLIWGFLCILLITLYYSRYVKSLQSIEFRKITIPFFLILVMFSIFNHFIPVSFKFNNAYFVLGIIFILAPITGWILFGKRTIRILRVLPYFFLIGLLFEIAAIKNGLWTYPGNYIYIIQLNEIIFPLEEMLFWLIGLPICTSTILASISKER